MPSRLSDMERDGLREIGEIAAGSAGVAASKLLSRPIKHATSQFYEVPVGGLAQAIQGAEDLEWVGAAVALGGDIRGTLLMAADTESARWIADKLLDREEGTTEKLGALEQSALKEYLNIVTGSYLRSFYEFLGLDVDFGVPMFAVARWSAMLRYTFVGTTPGAKLVWAIESRLDVGKPLVFLLLLDAKGLDIATKALHKRL